MNRLTSLLGTWQGTGHGEYPTITSFDYTETLTFQANQNQDVIHYIQQTWRKDNDGQAIDSHWESGFICQLDDGSIEISNVQNSGRMELLAGQIRDADDALELTLQSVQLANDIRMKETSRVWRWTGDTLIYDMHMATQNTPELQIHLRAELKKG